MTCIGILVCVLPILLGWSLPLPNELNSSSSSLPLLKALNSIEYPVSLIASMAMSVHMVFDFFGHALILPLDMTSYRDTTSNLILLICLLIPDLIQLFYVIPYSDCIAFHCIQYVRVILTASGTLAYLGMFGGSAWQSMNVVSAAGLVVVGSTIRFYSCFFKDDSYFLTLEILTCVAFGIGNIIILPPSMTWIRNVLPKIFSKHKITLTSDEYCCNVYFLAGFLTVAGLWGLTLGYSLPKWFEYDAKFLVMETMLFSFYYVVVTVFQGRAAVREAALSKVSSLALRIFQ